MYEAAITPRDCPEELATVHHLAAALPHVTKPMMFGPLSKLEQQTCLELAAAAAGGPDELRERPFLGMGMCSLSPLQLTEQGTDVCLFAARNGLPLSILAMCMAGGTTPQTLAGTLVVHNAEVLAGTVMVQLAERGAPVIYSSSSTAMDLPSRHRLRRHPRDCAAELLRRASQRPLRDAVLGGRVVGGLEGERTRRRPTTRPSPDLRQRWQGPA